MLVALAAGSVVAAARHGGLPGFEALMPAAGAAAGVYMFGRVSMAHLNPAVTLGMWASGLVSGRMACLYTAAQACGALAASAFVALAVGEGGGPNVPGPHPYWQLFAAEAAAAAALMFTVLASVRTGGMRGMGGLAIGAAVGLGVLALGGFSGASMNPARSLGPALASGTEAHLLLYVPASLAGAALAALALRLWQR